MLQLFKIIREIDLFWFHEFFGKSLWKLFFFSILGWPHLNDCINSLEILNIGGTNVLGEFIPFILLHAKNLKSLGQWINTMVYGLEILRALPGHQNSTFPNIQEFSYSTDRFVCFFTQIIYLKTFKKLFIYFSEIISVSHILVLFLKPKNIEMSEKKWSNNLLELPNDWANL